MLKIIKKIFTKKSDQNKGQILYVHGYSSSSLDHLNVQKMLVKRGYQYFSLDLPGHGVRKKLDDWSSLNFEILCESVLNFINDQKLHDFIIIGHSLGGAICMAIYPQIQHLVKAVILEDPYNNSVFNRRSLDIKEAYQAIREGYFNNTKKDDVKQTISEFWNSKIGYRRLFLSLLAPRTLINISKGAKAISVPTLVISGKDDPIIPYRQLCNFMMSRIDNLTIELIPNARHCPFLQNPKAYNKALLNFLKTLKDS